MLSFARLLPLTFLAVFTAAQKIVLTNDDGWAVAQIRAEFEALEDAGYNVVLSAPSQNVSGTGGISVPSLPNVLPCEYNSCPALSSSKGFNASDPRLNYVGALPADAVDYGITTLAPKFFGGKPDLVVSGPNVGQNLAIANLISGTLGAAGQAVKDGIPAIAFSGSGSSTAQEAWTALTDTPNSPTVLAARTYSDLTIHFLSAVFSQPPKTPALLPSGVVLNVNFPTLSNTCQGDNVQWIFTRAFPVVLDNPDVVTCNNGGVLPQESSVVQEGCFASVSVLDASTKADANKTNQADVLQRLSNLGFSCLPS